MAAYWQAIGQLTGAAVEAAIFSTALGQLIIYEPDQLRDEWSRLLRLSQEEFERELAANPNYAVGQLTP